MMSNYSKVCHSCGVELPGDASKCYKCGAILEWRRNAFVTFWLWLCIVANVLGLVGIIDVAAFLPAWYTMALFGLVVLVIIGFAMLLSWNRAGFGMVLGANLGSMTFTFIVVGDINAYTLISCIVSTLVLFCVLQCTKDGFSYWEAMKLKADGVGHSAHTASAAHTYTYRAPQAPVPAPTPAHAVPANVAFHQKPNVAQSYWLNINGEQSGPFTVEQLKKMLIDGEIDASSLIWDYGMAKWKKLENIPELDLVLAQTPPPVPVPPSKEYWVAVNGQKFGPYNMQQMKDMAQNGQINASMLVWAQDMPQWEVARSVPEVAALFAQTPPAL